MNNNITQPETWATYYARLAPLYFRFLLYAAHVATLPFSTTLDSLITRRGVFMLDEQDIIDELVKAQETASKEERAIIRRLLSFDISAHFGELEDTFREDRKDFLIAIIKHVQLACPNAFIGIDIERKAEELYGLIAASFVCAHGEEIVYGQIELTRPTVSLFLQGFTPTDREQFFACVERLRLAVGGLELPENETDLVLFLLDQQPDEQPLVLKSLLF